jgi:hypothetical protein
MRVIEIITEARKTIDWMWLFDPKRKQVQKAFLELYPQVKLFNWIQLGK